MSSKFSLQFRTFIALAIFFITPAFAEENHLPIDHAGWEQILKQKKDFTTAELIDKSSDLIAESWVAKSNGEAGNGLTKALAAFIIANHVQKITQGSESNQKLAKATKQLEEYLYNSGLSDETISNSYSTFLEYSTTAGITIKHYTIDDVARNPIPPQRLHWPNTVINHYDSQGKLRGYSVLPARRR